MCMTRLQRLASPSSLWPVKTSSDIFIAGFFASIIVNSSVWLLILAGVIALILSGCPTKTDYISYQLIIINKVELIQHSFWTPVDRCNL